MLTEKEKMLQGKIYDPCRVIRQLTEQDSIRLRKELFV